MAPSACFAPALAGAFGQISAYVAWTFVVILFAASLLGTPLVMWLYKRRVLAFMASQSAEAIEAPQLDAPIPAPGAAVPAATLVAAADARTARLKRVLLAACTLYSVAAGLLLTLAPESPFSASERLQAVPTGLTLVVMTLADILLVGALCQPMVLIGIAHPRFKRLYWTRFAPLIAVALALRFGVASDDGAGMGFGMAVVIAPFAALFIVLFYAAIARRHARQVGPLLNLLLSIVFTGVLLAAVVVAALSRCVGEAAAGFVVLAFPVLFGLFVWGAWRAARAGATLYEHKRLSDAQVQVGSWLVTLTAFVLIGIVSIERPENGPWVLALAAVTAAAFLAYLLGLRGAPVWAQPQGLLLLRVFAQDERGEVLLDETAFRWRFIGPIHMIGGPDMAQQTLDPQELLLFVRGRAREQFVAGHAQLAQRLTALDEAPDPDGRYRVNELFCFDRIWQHGVAALLARSRAVLLDLRGYTAARAGTSFEIGLLARADALRRTVCLVDERTDLAAVHTTVGAHGPGRLADAQMLTTGQALDARALFAALAEAAAR